MLCKIVSRYFSVLTFASGGSVSRANSEMFKKVVVDYSSTTFFTSTRMIVIWRTKTRCDPSGVG